MEITIESVESSKLKRGAMGELAESIFRLSALVGTALDKPIKYFLGLRDSTAIAIGIEAVAANPATVNSFIVSIPADANSGPVASNALGQDEIEA